MDIQYYLSNICSGIAYGSVYGLFGLAIVLLYRTNHLFNFAQTEIATLLVIAMLLFPPKRRTGPFGAVEPTLVLPVIVLFETLPQTILSAVPPTGESLAAMIAAYQVGCANRAPRPSRSARPAPYAGCQKLPHGPDGNRSTATWMILP